MDWTQAATQLSAPLNSAHVKEREGGGKKVLSYIESWWAISEANRIFGFDGWTSETVEIKCVSEKERLIGKPEWNKKGWGVSYTAKVRVTVDGVAREGVGAGHGIDVDLGLAHESAIKEAESDARKRALMTFGNPFGLALYDKTQAMVTDEPLEPPEFSAGPGNPDTKYYKTNGTTPKAVQAQQNNALFATMEKEIRDQHTVPALEAWWKRRIKDINNQSPQGVELLKEKCADRKAEILSAPPPYDDIALAELDRVSAP